MQKDSSPYSHDTVSSLSQMCTDCQTEGSLKEMRKHLRDPEVAGLLRLWDGYARGIWQ